jgi:hypothetical protein
MYLVRIDVDVLMHAEWAMQADNVDTVQQEMETTRRWGETLNEALELPTMAMATATATAMAMLGDN